MHWLKLHNCGNRAFELSKISAEIARGVADCCDRSVFVAGSVGPTGEPFWAKQQMAGCHIPCLNTFIEKN